MYYRNLNEKFIFVNFWDFLIKKLYSFSLRIQWICNKINKLLILAIVRVLLVFWVIFCIFLWQRYAWFEFVWRIKLDRKENVRKGNSKVISKKSIKKTFPSCLLISKTIAYIVEIVIFLVTWIIDIRNDEPNEWQFHIGETYVGNLRRKFPGSKTGSGTRMLEYWSLF